jgi:hypothetical protein
MTTTNTETQSNLFTIFSAYSSSPEERRAALSELITAKLLPKYAEKEAVSVGRDIWLGLAKDNEADPKSRLLAIAESIRLGQTVKRWMHEIIEQLQPAFEKELPPIRLLQDADDRLNLARACSEILTPWMPNYLAYAVSVEETGEKARSVLMSALLSRSSSLNEAISKLGTAFAILRPETAAPGDTIAKRLTRSLSAFRENLLECELDTGEDLGQALYFFLSKPLVNIGKPEEEKVRIDLSREALLTVHDIVRSHISVVADPQMYRVVEYCRNLFPGSNWPDELSKTLERLIVNVCEALVLLGRQGQCDQLLLGQLEVLCKHSERARIIARDLAKRHPELPENVRDWLERGKVRIPRQASESAIEQAAGNADETIGLALQAARKSRLLRDDLSEQLISNLQIYEPNLCSRTQELLDNILELTIQIEQISSLRSLDLYGKPGEEIEMSPKFFTVVGGLPLQHMTVIKPAIVRIRSDGVIGEVVTKGLVE